MSNPSNAPVQYNSQAAHQHLMALAQYLGSPTFPALVVWRPGPHDVLCVRGPPNSPIESVMCVVVGVFSPEKAYFGPNGTFNPRWEDPLKNAKTAKWQGTLECPVGDPHFAADWAKVMENVQAFQGQVAVTPDKRHLMLPGQKLRLGRNAWEPKTEENNTPTRNAITNNYPIGAQYAEWWNLVKETHQIDLMPVYDTNDNLNTRVETWESQLVGAVVEVTFSVKHYYMGVTPSRPKAYDVFSANIESISVLVRPPPVVRNPYRASLSPTKPRAVPQGPIAISSAAVTTGTGLVSGGASTAFPGSATLPAAIHDAAPMASAAAAAIVTLAPAAQGPSPAPATPVATIAVASPTEGSTPPILDAPAAASPAIPVAGTSPSNLVPGQVMISPPVVAPDITNTLPAAPVASLVCATGPSAPIPVTAHASTLQSSVASPALAPAVAGADTTNAGAVPSIPCSATTLPAATIAPAQVGVSVTGAGVAAATAPAEGGLSAEQVAVAAAAKAGSVTAVSAGAPAQVGPIAVAGAVASDAAPGNASSISTALEGTSAGTSGEIGDDENPGPSSGRGTRVKGKKREADGPHNAHGGSGKRSKKDDE